MEKAQNLLRGSPDQYGYHGIDLNKHYQMVNGLNSIGGIPEELEEKNGLMILNWRGMTEELFN